MYVAAVDFKELITGLLIREYQTSKQQIAQSGGYTILDTQSQDWLLFIYFDGLEHGFVFVDSSDLIKIM